MSSRLSAKQVRNPEQITKQVNALADITSYAGPLTSLQVYSKGRYTFKSDSTLTVDGVFILSATGKGVTTGPGRWIMDCPDGCLNVQFAGADPKGVSDSAPAFQKCIDFAKAQSATNNGTFRYTIIVPHGWYMIKSQLNLTNANGIVITGPRGSYINAGLIGCTSNTDGTGQGIILDMTGSTRCFVENLTLDANSAWGNTASKIAVQFALSQDGNGNQLGGLNCGIRNCYIQLYDAPSLNGGLGTVGVLNVRAEEFVMADCYIKANSCAAFSNRANFSTMGTGITHVATSAYATVATTANGSMGVVDCIGQMSLHAIEYRMPPLILNGVNSLRYHGYLGIVAGASLGSNRVAILCTQQCDNLQISGTVEGHSTLLRATTALNATVIRVITANQSDTAQPIFDLTGCMTEDTNLFVRFGNPAEMTSSRILLYHASSNNTPATGYFLNSSVTCRQWADNRTAISTNLLRRSQNAYINTHQSFRKVSAATVESMLDYNRPLGTRTAPGGTVINFSLADKTDTSAGNGGVYSCLVEGVITGGNYNSGGRASLQIRGTVSVSQDGNSARSNAQFTGIVGESVGVNPGYLTITDFTLSMTFASGQGSVTLTPVVSGSAGAEPLQFVGTIRFTSDFAVNQSVIFQ